MRRGSGPLRWRVLISVVCLALAVSVPAIALGATLTPVYRFYNTKAGTHFYTASETEKANVLATMGGTYSFEGVAYQLETDNPQMNAPLYRFYNKVTGTHFYTASETEKNLVLTTMATTFNYEGVAYNVSLNATGNIPVYRFYNTKVGGHFYTASEAEKTIVLNTMSGVYRYEGPAFYLAYTAGPTPPTGDVTAPTTTTDLKSVYRGLATIRFFAVDNAGGTGVDRTYYNLDSLGVAEGTIAYASSQGTHTIEYWSVDKAGNVETHHIANFTIVSVHAEPDIEECTVCHSGDLMTLHEGPGCVACHGTGITPSFDCADCHYAPEKPFHDGLPGAHDGSAETCTDAGCHDNDVSVIHDTMLSNGETPPSCAACHADGVTPSTECASCHDGYADIHPALGADVHKVVGFCYTVGCHVTYGGAQKSDVTLLHNTWAKNPGCAACHASGVEPTLTCFDSDCHGAGGMTLEDTHMYHDTFDASGDNSGGCTACHSTDIAVAHTPVGCSCHTETHYNDMMAPLLEAGDTECLDCHEDPMDPNAAYPYHVDAHAVVQDAIAANSAGCVACHGEDLMAVLPAGNPVTGVSEHNYCSCHEYGEAEGKTACEDCHGPAMDASTTYPYHVDSHTAFEAGVDGDVSSSCVSCHGSNLLTVGAVDLHVKDAHAGCVCHAYDDLVGEGFGLMGATTAAAGECADCHEGSMAPHGFADGVSAHHAESWVAASGHNTTTFGTIGATEDFEWDPDRYGRQCCHGCLERSRVSTCSGRMAILRPPQTRCTWRRTPS